jgi:hypothetical protein
VEKEEEIIHQSGELSVLRLSGIHSSSVRPRPLELLAIRLHKERDGGREGERVSLAEIVKYGRQPVDGILLFIYYEFIYFFNAPSVWLRVLITAGSC